MKFLEVKLIILLKYKAERKFYAFFEFITVGFYTLISAIYTIIFPLYFNVLGTLMDIKNLTLSIRRYMETVQSVFSMSVHIYISRIVRETKTQKFKCVNDLYLEGMLIFGLSYIKLPILE